MKKTILLFFPVLISLSSCAPLIGPDTYRNILKDAKGFDMLKFMKANTIDFKNAYDYKKSEVKELDPSKIKTIDNGYVIYEEGTEDNKTYSVMNLMNGVYSFKNIEAKNIVTKKSINDLPIYYDNSGNNPIINYNGEVIVDNIRPEMFGFYYETHTLNNENYYAEHISYTNKENDYFRKTNVYKGGDKEYKYTFDNDELDLVHPKSVEEFAEYNDLTKYGLPGYHFLRNEKSISLFDKDNKFIYNSSKLRYYFMEGYDNQPSVKCDKYFFRFKGDNKVVKFDLLTGEETEYEIKEHLNFKNFLVKNYDSKKTDLIINQVDNKNCNLYDTNFKLIYKEIPVELCNKYYKLDNNHYMSAETLRIYDSDGRDNDNVNWLVKDKTNIRMSITKDKKVFIDGYLFEPDGKTIKKDLLPYQINGQYYSKYNVNQNLDGGSKIETLDNELLFEFDHNTHLAHYQIMHDPINERILNVAFLENMLTNKIETIKYYFLETNK